MDSLQQRFVELLAAQGITLDSGQLEQFERYYRELVTWNEKMNLTGITEREQVYIKHFYDSLSPAFFTPMDELVRVADIGSGAGFPSLPLKICFPHLQITIIDSLNKRIQFLQHLVHELGFSQVDCVHARAEDAARNEAFRDSFDLVTARAVAKLNVLSELCLPFVKLGQLFAAMKGADPEEEKEESLYAISELGARLDRTVTFELPMEHSKRHILLIKKLTNTPKKYPRKPGIPLKLPLVE